MGQLAKCETPAEWGDRAKLVKQGQVLIQRTATLTLLLLERLQPNRTRRFEKGTYFSC